MIMKHHRMWTAFIRAHFNGTVLPAVILIVNVPLQAMKEFFKKQSVKKEARQTEITTVLKITDIIYKLEQKT